jgi:hypothetical protein
MFWIFARPPTFGSLVGPLVQPDVPVKTTASMLGRLAAIAPSTRRTRWGNTSKANLAGVSPSSAAVTRSRLSPDRPSDSPSPGFLLQVLFQFVEGDFALALQPEQHAWIDGARPPGHGYASLWGESHGSVHAASLVDSAHGDPAAEMGDEDVQLVRSPVAGRRSPVAGRRSPVG